MQRSTRPSSAAAELRSKSGEFREQRSLETSTSASTPPSKRGLIYELATCHFIRQKRDVLLFDRTE